MVAFHLLSVTWSKVLASKGWSSKDNGFGGGITFSTQDDCRELSNCTICLDDPSCGWCKDYNLCVSGNKTGPKEGSCDWYYYQCPNSHSTTTIPKTTFYPKYDNSSWLTYGGNYQHTGYSKGFNIKLDSSYYANRYYYEAFKPGFNMGSIGVINNRLYFCGFNPLDIGRIYVFSYDITDSSNSWEVDIKRTTNDFEYNYCSGVSISTNGEYVLLLGAGTDEQLIVPITVNVETKETREYSSYVHFYPLLCSVFNISFSPKGLKRLIFKKHNQLSTPYQGIWRLNQSILGIVF